MILGSEVINIKHLEFNELVESYAGIARYTFLLQNTTEPFPINQFGLSTYMLIPVYVAMNFFYFLGGHFFDLSVLMGALTIRHLARVFGDMVNNHPDPYYINMVSVQQLNTYLFKINGQLLCIYICHISKLDNEGVLRPEIVIQ